MRVREGSRCGARCLVSECRGISQADPAFREGLWARYFTAAPSSPLVQAVINLSGVGALQAFDALILELESSRDMLHSEATRVQREIVQYSTLIQGALHSTKIIAESLRQWVPDAQTLSD